MIRLGTSGMLMVMSEVIAFNILSVLAGYFSLTHLATQPMLVTTISLTWQPAFASSVATATRIAHFIGAGRVSAAKYTAAVGLSWGAILGVFNSCLVYSTRWHVPRLLTDDEDIVILFANTALMVSLTTFWDTLSAFTNGLLRGLGWQKFGGRVCLTTYYVISMPISIATAFWLGCELNGLWTGVFIAQIM